MSAVPRQAYLSPHEKWIIERATEYVTCVFRGRGAYDKHHYATLEDARDGAAKQQTSHGRGVMIYAIYRNHQAMVEIHPGANVAA